MSWVTPTPVPPQEAPIQLDLPMAEVMSDFTYEMIGGYNALAVFMDVFIWILVAIIIVALFVDVWRRIQNL